MLTALKSSDYTKIGASIATRADGPFVCPKCFTETILKKGMIKTPHFAHKPPILCEYGKGESELHRRCKSEIYAELAKNQNISVELEKDLGSVVPDIYVELKHSGLSFAIEVQISNLTMQKIIQRTREYHSKNIPVLWMTPYNDALDDERYSPKAWEKWMHATYFGRVYYWKEKNQVVPVHFEDYQLYREEAEWYEEGGNLRTEGGYSYRSKRYRKVNKGRAVALPENFSRRHRAAWAGGDVVIPECSIMLDNQPRWW